MAILPENEYTEFEGKSYINPEISLGESNSFIDNLRSAQQETNQQIRTDTYNLGTSVPSNLGGLVGGEGYWTSRTQTPRTNSLVNDLRTAAQADALNKVLSNEQAKWQTRYTRAANEARIRGSNASGGSGGGGGTTKTTEGGVDYDDNSNNADVDIEKSNEDVVQKITDANGFLTGKERVYHPDGTYEVRDSYYTHNLPRSAGMSEILDRITGKFNYTLTDDYNNTYEVEEGGNKETTVKGDDGYFYLHDEQSNKWTRITGNKGTSSGGGWWRKVQ